MKSKDARTGERALSDYRNMRSHLENRSTEENAMRVQPTILVVVEHKDAIVRAGIHAVLASAVDMEVCAILPGTTACVETADVVITDYVQAMLRSDAATQLGAKMVPTLILTQKTSDWDVHRAVTAGVQGYLLQSDSCTALRKAVRALHGGSPFLSPAIKTDPPIATLTRRESEVLMLMGEGCCNKAIARELNIGIGTVKTYVKGAFIKLGARTRTHAVALGTQRGLLQYDAPGQRPLLSERLRS
jgi:two-component system NarL family response regulator